MTRKKIISLFICIILMVMIPTFVKAANAQFSLTKSVYGVWKAIEKYKGDWLTAPRPTDYKGWGNEVANDGYGVSLIFRPSALCLGHAKTSASNTKGENNIKTIIDVNENTTDYNKLLIGYTVAKNIEDKKENIDDAEDSDIQGNEGPIKPYIIKYCYENINLSNNYDSGNMSDKKYSTAAKNYADANTAKKEFSTDPDSTTQQIKIVNGNTFIGPYTLKSYGGEIEKAVVYTRDGKKYETEKYSSNGSSINNLGKTTAYNSKTFYVVVEGVEVESVDHIVLYKNYGVIARTRIVIFENQIGDQNIGLYYGEIEDEEESEVELELPGVPYSNIKLSKIDADSGERIAGMGLVLYSEEAKGYLVQGTPCTYTSDINKATEFITTTNLTEIKNVPKAGKYIVYETTSIPGLGYEFVSKENPLKVGEFTINGLGQNVTITVENKKEYMHVTITKIDADSGDEMEGLGVVLYDATAGKYVVEGEPSTYVDDINQATVYKTQKGGVQAHYLKRNHEYIVYEVLNPFYGYEEVSMDNPLELTRFKLNGDGMNIDITAENVKKTGNLKIEKRDYDDENKPLPGVTFKIKNSKGEYIVAIDENGNKQSQVVGTIYLGGMETTTNETSATEFVTDENGNIFIYNILIDTYTVIETSIGDHYGYILEDPYVFWETSTSSGTGLTSTIEVERQESYNTETSVVGSEDDIYSLLYILNQKQTGNLRIEKKDADNDAKIQGVSFRLRKNLSTEDQEALADFVDGKGDVNSNGYLEEEDLNLVLRYVTGKTDLTTQQQNAADVNGDGQVNIVDMRLLMRKIQSSGYVVGMQGDSLENLTPITTATGTVYFDNMTTTNNPDEATTFVTDEEGLVEIYNILTGSYIVEEISVGDNFGYDIDPNFISWEVTNSNGTKTTVNQSTSATIEVTRQKSTDTTSTAAQNGTGSASEMTNKNRRKYIKVSGYAWEDKTDGKGSQKDYQWTDGTEDRRLQYITVTLKNADGIVLDTRVTNANGEYNFGNYDEDSSAIKLEIDELPGAYIEFEYNGMSYQSIPINSEFEMISATNTGGLNTANIISGRKNSATDEGLRDAFNNNYATVRKGISENTQDQKVYDIQYTYSDYISKVVYGDSVNYGYEGQTYPISGVYDQYEITAVTNANENNALCTQYTTQDIRQNSVLEIAGINLGVEEREMPDLNLSEQDLEKIEVQLNDYTHTYKYGQVSADPDGFAGGDVSNIAVRFASKYFESSYTREIYTADVVYNKQPGNEGKLKMYMTYKIEITNEATSLNSTVKTIANYYDARYENMVITDENGNTIDYQIDDSYNVNGLKKMEIYVNQQLQAQTLKTITIRYQLNNDAINALLNGETTLDSISEITGYSTYMDNTFTTPYAGIDVDSAPDTVIPGDRSTYEDDTNWAPSLILVLKEGRIIQGTVWEDAPIEDLLQGTGYDKQRIGDGQYQSSENIVNNVKVDLMLIDESGNLTLAKLYKRDETVVDATTTTSGKGEYSFVGVEPGNYVIRYTYGDNSVICDVEGNEIKNVDADIYKSTIYRGGNKDAVNSMTDYWYRGETSHEGAIRLSDAKDNEEFVNDRITEEEVNYETVTDRMQLTEISADTRKFDIKLDYDINLDNISEYGVDLKFVFDNIDFGIIERPRQSLQIDKEIGYLQLTLANGVNTINGDPRSQNLSGVVALPDGNIHIEVDNEIIQGATLKVTYNITVDNSNCEIDYNDEDYYIYGTVPANKEEVFKIATVVDMFDYLPEDVVLESTDGNNWEGITISEDMKGTLLANEVYEVVKNLQNVIHLKNPVFENMQPGSEAVDTSMVVTKQLSVSSDDLVYENDVEIVKLKGRRTIDSIPGNYDPTTNTPDEYDDDRVELTITGPTGENRQYIIYGAIGIGMLIIVGIGIVIIKRKILKK